MATLWMWSLFSKLQYLPSVWATPSVCLAQPVVPFSMVFVPSFSAVFGECARKHWENNQNKESNPQSRNGRVRTLGGTASARALLGTQPEMDDISSKGRNFQSRKTAYTCSAIWSSPHNACIRPVVKYFFLYRHNHLGSFTSLRLSGVARLEWEHFNCNFKDQKKLAKSGLDVPVCAGPPRCRPYHACMPWSIIWKKKRSELYTPTDLGIIDLLVSPSLPVYILVADYTSKFA